MPRTTRAVARAVKKAKARTHDSGELPPRQPESCLSHSKLMALVMMQSTLAGRSNQLGHTSKARVTSNQAQPPLAPPRVPEPLPGAQTPQLWKSEMMTVLTIMMTWNLPHHDYDQDAPTTPLTPPHACPSIWRNTPRAHWRRTWITSLISLKGKPN